MGKKKFSVVGYTPAEIFKFLNLNNFAKINFFSKMILAHGSGSQENQFDEKNGGQKSRDTIPLKRKGHKITKWLEVVWFRS
jgi:hypothetical protein